MVPECAEGSYSVANPRAHGRRTETNLKVVGLVIKTVKAEKAG